MAKCGHQVDIDSDARVAVKALHKWGHMPFISHEGNGSRPLKNTAHGPLWAGGQQFEKRVFPPRFLAFFCGFSEENIVFVLHYDLKCIFQDNLQVFLKVHRMVSLNSSTKQQHKTERKHCVADWLLRPCDPKWRFPTIFNR